jgi:small conductance mechanosensitive channel
MLFLASEARIIDFEEKMGVLVDLIIGMGIKFIGAVIVVVIGLKVIKVFTKLIKRSLNNSKMEPSVATFLASIINISLKVMVLITGASMMGLEMTSFIAVLSTASLAIGLSLQGSLSNFAGGVLILLLKPFQVGDYIIEDFRKNEGTVVSIEIFYTKLRTSDNRIVIVPNGTLSNNSLTNVAREPYRRLDLTVNVAYNTDIPKVKELLKNLLRSYEYVASDEVRKSIIAVSGLDARSMQIEIRAWVETDHFMDVRYAIFEDIKETFDKNKIEIPFEKLEVNLKNEPKKILEKEYEK